MKRHVITKVTKGISSAYSKPDQVCLLQKSLYGLKQASRQWFSKLSSALLSSGYHQSPSDHSLFVKNTAGSFTALLIYVDDVILTGDSMAEISSVKQFLDSRFCIKDLGDLRYFLGLEVARSKQGISLNQRKYALDLVADAGLLGCKPASTSMDSSSRLSKSQGEPLTDITGYRRMIGRLLYLTTTRPDISFSVHQLSQFLASPTSAHHQAALRILNYIKGTTGVGLLFPSTSDLKLQAYSDADWAGCPDTRRSITGYCIYLGDALISWKSKKQSTISRSSCEAEYRALAATTCELQWLSYLLKDFNISSPSPATIFCDNASAIHIARNPSFHERTKHIELDCHLVREKLSAGLIHLLPISTKLQVADILTKPLPTSTFQLIYSKLGLLSLFDPSPGQACGGV